MPVNMCIKVQYPPYYTTATETQGQETMLIKGHSCGEVAFIHIWGFHWTSNWTPTGPSDNLTVHSECIHCTTIINWEASALFSISPLSNYMAIEIPLALVCHTCSNRLPYPYSHPKMVVWPETSVEGHLNRDHGCGILPVQRQQYSQLGYPLAGTNFIRPGTWFQRQPTTHQCLEGSSHLTVS